MQSTVKNLSKTRIEVNITLGTDELAEAEQVSLVKLARDLKVAGFRKGKVPISVAKKNVDPQKLQEAILDTAVSKAVAKTFIEKGIQAIDRPEVEVTKYVPSDNLEFKATVDILPEVKLGNYKKLKAKRQKVAIDTKDVDEVIDRILQNFAEKKEVTRKAQEGDEVVIDFIGKKGGVAFDGGTATDHTLKLGTGQFIPGFEEGLVGHKAGEKVDLELEFPKDYHAADLAGAKVIFETTIKKVQETKLPEPTDEIAKQAGPFETFAQLRKDVEAEILANKEREVDGDYKDALIDELVDASEVEAPTALVEGQVERLERDFSQNLLYRGLTIDSYIRTNGFKDEDDWRSKELKPAAERRVKSSMVLNALAKSENISATDKEIDDHVELHKSRYVNDPEALKQFETEEMRSEIANHYVIEKTIDKLVELNQEK